MFCQGQKNWWHLLRKCKILHLQRRRFTFFDLKENIDSGKIADAIGKARVTSTANGYGLLILGDSSGNVHIVNKAFEVRSFQAYQLSITLAEQNRNAPYLVTIGEDGGGLNPYIKVWHVEKNDKYDMPVCLNITKASIPNTAVVPTCISVLDNLTMMAVGFNDGSILLYRGDVKRGRSLKSTILKNDNDPISSITGLSFYPQKNNLTLYVATVNSVVMFDVTHKDKEKITVLGKDEGCSLRCSVLAEQENHFFVARKRAVYCYTNGVLGPCYAVDGEKVQLQWFRGYLIIVAKDSQPVVKHNSVQKMKDSNRIPYMITVLDIQNNVTAYNSQLFDVSAVLIEWGSFYILPSDNNLALVAEKDLHSKLTLLFKKNLYDVAIRVAKYHQYDSDGLMEIFLQYGDYLYSKGDHKGAIEQYIKTIGKLEPSYVIRKYLGSQQVENLTTYLQALHKEGVANGGHTTLLLNFYTKLNKPELLKEFIMTKDRNVDFDVEVAIDVCRYVSSEDALLLAEKHSRHDWYLTIQIEDHKKYKEALDYIAKLPFDEAESMIKKYGISLLDHEPEGTTRFLIRLCTDYKPSNEPLVDSNALDGYSHTIINRSPPENFIHYFLNNSEMLVTFLENLVQYYPSKWDSQVYTTLLEHYIEVWAAQKEFHAKLQYETKIMRLLESPDSTCDKLQALVLCKAADFKPGLIYLYEQNKMYKAIMKYHLNRKDYASILGCCRRFEHQEPGLWVQALWSVSSHWDLPQEVLTEILTAIERGNLMSPLLVIDALSHTPSIRLGNIRDYLKKILDTESSVFNEQQKDIDKYRKGINEIQENIEDFKNKPAVFQASRCGICNKQLELPTVHFLCQHSFHQQGQKMLLLEAKRRLNIKKFMMEKICIESFADHENECPPCLEINKQTIEAIKSQDENRDLHEIFHSQLEHAEDGFALVTDYLGRGVFTKLANCTEVEMRAAALRSKIDKKIGLTTNRNPHNQPKSYTQNNPREQVLNNNVRNDNSRTTLETLEYNIMETKPKSSSSVNTFLSPSSDRISTMIASSNPFGDANDADDEDSSDHHEEAVSTNPFGDYDGDEEEEQEEEDPDDYDKNLNPFS